MAGLLQAIEPRAAAEPVEVATAASQQTETPRADVRAVTTPVIAGPRAASLDEAEQARRNGDHSGSAAVLRLLVASSDARIAFESQLQLAVVLLESRRGPEAVDVANALLGRQLSTSDRAATLIVRGRAQRVAGDCGAAIGSFGEARQFAQTLSSTLDLLIADCFAALGDRANQSVYASSAAGSAGSRLARVDALEYLVDAALKSGNREAALAPSEQLLAHAGTRTYRAKTLSSIGSISLELGRKDAAALAFATVVAELPETTSAAPALDSLAQLRAMNLVATDKAGVVEQFAKRPAAAIVSLRTARAQGLPADRAAQSLYHEGLSLIQLDRIDEAVELFRQIPPLAPDSDLAARGLLRAGRAHERDGRLTPASDVYELAADGFPSAAAGQEARARLVVSLVRRGAFAEAVASGRAIADRDADPKWKGLALFWAGKAFARAGDPTQARGSWADSADVDPDDFGGLRSRAILDGDGGAIHSPRKLDPSRLEVTDSDRADLDAWSARHGASTADLDQQMAADANVVLARELYRVGLRELASWELQEVATRRATEPASLVWIAGLAAERGDVPLGMRIGIEARKVAGEPLSVLPKIAQKLIYPLPYVDLIASGSAPRNVDPLLFAALIRQESAFNPVARSSANALGLTQVVPATGEGIARALGRADFRNDDLLRPIVSVEFGLYYLSRQLEQYGGKIYPALAAYNAGGANVNRWLGEFGADDMDLFAERIPFAETHHYVQVVYENYRIYQRLYGG